MSTEYRRGIPSVAHVEAATRLGLEWHRQGCTDTHRTVFLVRVPTAVAVAQRMLNPDGVILSDYGLHPEQLNRTLNVGPTSGWEQRQSYRPIRPDGTPVDWEVLDAEVARVGQRGQPQTMACNLTASTQSQGFRADLWLALSSHLTPGNGCRLSDTVRLDWRGFRVQNPFFTAEIGWPGGFNSTDILVRWTVYQELKPLYDLVDGAQGEAAMPRDVEAEWYRAAQRPWTRPVDNWLLARDSTGLMIKNRYNMATWQPDEAGHGTPLRNFAAVLDAVAEQRVAERNATAAEPTPSVSPLREQRAPQSATPEPHRFSDVRPDRHGWRWWRLFGSDCSALGTLIEASPIHSWRVKDDPEADWHMSCHYNNAVDGIRTVIPTDEQGNPVSWESIGQGRSAAQTGRDVEEDRPRPIERRIQPTFMPAPGTTAAIEAARLNEQRLAENPELWREAQREAVSSPRTAEAIYQDLLARQRTRVSDGYAVRNSDKTDLHDSLKPTPLPRFTADELDDVDHSATTTQDSAILKRGKLPTVEAIGKYREVMAKRNGTVTEAVKASGIDCEVAQYVLERWAGGLSDREAEIICDKAYGAVSFTRADIAKRLSHWFAIIRPTLDTSEPADTAAQRQRAEAAERKARMAALQAQLAKERATLKTESIEEPTRFSLLEVDEAADPSKSIEAWKAQRAANERRARNTVRPVTVTSPPPAPKRKPFEVVDAQADGLSGGAAFAVLLSRAMNQNC